MAQRSQRKVESSLLKKGFGKSDKDHRKYIYYSLTGKKTAVFTKTSHGNSIGLGDHLLSRMAKQCFLSKSEFLDLVDCPLSRQKYEERLKDRGLTAS